MLLESKIIAEELENKKINTSVQFGFLNASITKVLAEHGMVYLFSEMKFNPFKDNPRVKLMEGEHPVAAAKAWGSKKIVVDVIYLGSIKDYLSTSILLGVWGKNVRKNGFIFVQHGGEPQVKEAVDNYLKYLPEDSYSIKTYETVNGLLCVVMK